mgnify:FL=1
MTSNGNSQMYFYTFGMLSYLTKLFLKLELRRLALVNQPNLQLFNYELRSLRHPEGDIT